MTIDWDLPYASSREAVLGDGVVATSQPLAAQAGLEMLQRGGSAADAAIAAAITLTVVEPTANGIGGDAFALASDGDDLLGLNASGRSPALMTREAVGDLPATGWTSVTVPGAVSAWVALHERCGQRPFTELFEAAIGYARNGFPVSRQCAAGWKRAAARYESFADWTASFASGGVPGPGERFACPDQAATLEEIAASGGASFYRGDLAAAMDAASRAAGGLLRGDDLEAHEPLWVDPLSARVGPCRLHELPPNGQGIAALIALALLEALGARGECDDPALLHLQIEAMKAAMHRCRALVADPDHLTADVSAALEVGSLIGTIGQSAADLDPSAVPRTSSTVLVTTGDSAGRAVSFIQSNFEGFGSGIVIPGTGIAMQNRGIGFSLEAGHPNEVGPGKRPFHTIIPAMLSDEQGVRAAMGVMGGPMQPQGHLQVAWRMCNCGQNPQAALDAPRWRVLGGRRVAIEPGFDEGVYEALRARGHELELAEERSVAFGGGQVAWRLEDAWLGASDQRRDGQAVAI